MPNVSLKKAQFLIEHACYITYINSPVIREEVRVGTLPANTGTTGRTERMSDTFLTEGVPGHRVKSTDPSDIAFEWVDHKVAVGRTDGALWRAWVVSEISCREAETAFGHGI